jgi:beta-phosphoglucomutase-like phosphatase (HAD superfamily)
VTTDLYRNYAVLWDMDGVLVDTGNYHYNAWKKTFDDLDVPFDKEDFRKTFGMNNTGILEGCLEENQSLKRFPKSAKRRNPCSGIW